MQQITASNGINQVMLDDICFILLCVCLFSSLFNGVSATNHTCVTSAYFEEKESGKVRESGKVSQFSLVVRCYAGQQKGLGLILLWLSFLLEKVVCGHRLATVPPN